MAEIRSGAVEQKETYRLLSNHIVVMEDILEGHRIDLRITSMNLVAPTRAQQPGVTRPLVAVLATEIKTRRKSPLQWRLLASDESADAETARLIAHRSAHRSIEEFSTCSNLAYALKILVWTSDHVEDLRKCLAFDIITSWRVCDLARAATNHSQRGCQQLPLGFGNRSAVYQAIRLRPR